MLTGVDLDLVAELGRARDRLARAAGAREQADRAVESARAAARRAAESEGEARGLVDRLERELSTGHDRMPLIAAIEAAARRDPPAAAGPPDTSREAVEDAPPVDYDRTIAAAVEDAEARRAAAERSEWVRTNGRPPAPGEAAIAAAARRAVANDPILQQGIREAVEIIRAAAPDPPPPGPPETVRAARARRKAERHAAGRPVRASGAEAIAELDAARPAALDRGRARAAKVAPEECPPRDLRPPKSAPPPPPAVAGSAPDGAPIVPPEPGDSWEGLEGLREATEGVLALLYPSAADGAPGIPPPPGDAFEGLDGWRECSEAEWLAAAPMDRHETLRLVRTHRAITPRPPEEWRSEGLDSRLRSALGWLGTGGRLTDAKRPPTSLEILEELGHSWTNEVFIAKHADGYRVRGGKSPAFWMGSDTSRKPTLEGAALVERVRRVLGLPLPSATVVLGPAAPPRSGAYTPDGPATAKKRKRKEAAGAG